MSLAALVTDEAAGEPRRSELVAAEQVRALVAALMSAGAGSRSIADAAGVARGTVRAIVEGRVDRIRVGTSQKLMAVRLADIRGNALVDAKATLALLAALIDHGHPEWWIAAQLQPGAARPRLQVGRRRVRASTAAAVAELAERVGVNVEEGHHGC